MAILRKTMMRLIADRWHFVLGKREEYHPYERAQTTLQNHVSYRPIFVSFRSHYNRPAMISRIGCKGRPLDIEERKSVRSILNTETARPHLARTRYIFIHKGPVRIRACDSMTDASCIPSVSEIGRRKIEHSYIGNG